MSKKILSVLLALVMVLAMAPVSVFAGNPYFVISSTEAVVGENVTVTVGMQDMSALRDAELVFYYDSEYLEYVDITANADSGLSDWDYAAGMVAEGNLSFSFMYLDCAGRDRDLVDITFRVLKEGTSEVIATADSIEGCGAPEGTSVTIATNGNDDFEIPDDETPDVEENTGGYSESGGFSFIVTPSADSSTVDVTIGVLDEFEWGTFEIYFDAEYLEYVGYEEHDELESKRGSFYAGIPVGYTNEDGIISAGCMFSGSSGGALNLATFTFNVLAKESTTLTVVANADDWSYGNAPADGSVTINYSEESVLKGDVDGDGYTTSADARRILRIAAKLEVLDGSYFIVADIDENGNISASDARLALNISMLLESNDNAAPARTYLDAPRSEDVIIELPSVYDEAAQTLAVTVAASNVEGLQNANLFFEYDSQMLEFVSIEKANENIDMAKGGEYENGEISFAFCYMEACRESNIDIAVITFNVLSGGNSSISCDVGTWNGTDVPYDTLWDVTLENDYAIPDDFETPDNEENNGTYYESGGFTFFVTDAEVGSTVDVTIGVLDEFEWGSFEIYFDAEYLEYVGYEDHDELESKRGSFDAGIPIGYTNGDGIISAVCMFPTSSGGRLNLATFTFNVLKEGSSTLTVKATDDWGYCAPPSDGSITVGMHEHDYAEVVTAPTCVEEGYTTYTCSSCGDSYLDDFTSASHSYPSGSLTCDTCGNYALAYGINENDEAVIYWCDQSVNGDIVLPDTVTEIVYGFDTVTEIVYDFDTVTEIVYDAPEVYNVTAIVYGAFENCSSLKSVDIPNSVKSIGANSFVNCDSLKEITVPKSVTTIEEHAIGYSFDYDEYEYKLVDGVTIYGYAGSAAETYANENGIAFVAKITELVISDNSSISVTDTIANIQPEMSVEAVIKSVENKKVLIVSKDGTELATDTLVGTGNKVQVLDNDGKVLSEYEVMVQSDVDGNGKITPADARLALRASAGLDIIEGVYETAANYDGQDIVSTSDARMILRKAAGLE